MAMNRNPAPPEGAPDDELLPCGRTLEEIWEAYDSDPTPSDPHFADCPHCAEARDELSALEDVVRRVRQAEQESPAPEGLAARVMDIVRLELRPGRTLPLGEVEEESWIVESAAARMLRAAVDALPGVRAGSCLVEPAADPRGRDRGPVRIRVEVAAELTWNLGLLADEVRERLVVVAGEALGLPVGAVDVSVVDVLDAEAEEGSGR